ncbi:MAG: hypothetical protein C0490_18420 [Marivirga sp.]|nr:hypothetical protein [Marivirga sp.]
MAKAKVKTPIKKTTPLSGSEAVEEFMDGLDHPLKEIVTSVRALILGSNEKITEHVKWNAPSFCVNEVDKITFNLHNKEYVMLVFHKGAKAKSSAGQQPLFKDDSGLLEWVANDRAVLKLVNIQDVNSKEKHLKDLFIRWIKVTSEG